MKRNLWYIICVFSFFLISCQSNKKIEREKKAIIQVIEESTNAYKARKLSKLDSIYLHCEATTRIIVGKHGFVYEKGWEDIEAAYKTMFTDHPFSITTKYDKIDFTIKVYKNSAIAFHDEIIYDSENEYQRHQIGVHFLEKVKGQWKIVYLSYIDTSSYDEVE